MDFTGTKFEGGLEWANQTTLHPLGLTAIVVLGLALLALPRRYAVGPLLIMACFVASAQRIVLFNVDFTLLRVMVMIGWLRVLIRNEHHDFRWNALDVVMIAWTVTGTAAYVLLHGPSSMMFKLGTSYDAIGMYFLFRWLVRDFRDIERIALQLTLLALPLFGAFLIEKFTGRNMFAIFGGVPEITLVREGRLRCQGAFPVSILAGCFWAGALPLIVARWWRPYARKWLVLAGAVSALGVIVLCASSTPIMGVGAVLLATVLFRLRTKMRVICWSVVGCLTLLHFIMSAPVWHLISRVNVVGGSTGWHRYHLIDQFINRFDEWWLVGTKSTVHWGHQLYDVANQYVLEGVRGGLATFVLFCVAIYLAFRYVGRMWRSVHQQRAKLITALAVGASLFAHCICFIGVSYFGQIIVLWYLTLAMIGSVGGQADPQAAPIAQPTARSPQRTRRVRRIRVAAARPRPALGGREGQ